MRGTRLSKEYLYERDPLFEGGSRDVPGNDSGKQNGEDFHLGEMSEPTGALRLLAPGG